MIPKAPTPKIQSARFGVGTSPQARTVTQKVLRPAAPEPNRFEQRPVVMDRWGHMSLAGHAGDRAVVSQRGLGGGFGSSDIACAVVGFLVAAFLS